MKEGKCFEKLRRTEKRKKKRKEKDKRRRNSASEG